LSTRGYWMAKRKLVPASTPLSPGAEVDARNAFKFVFTCETFSDGRQKTIYASIKITNNGEVNVSDYEVIRGQIPGMDRDTAILLPDSDSMDGGTVEVFCLSNFDSHIQ
jgi:hypothetical protein